MEQNAQYLLLQSSVLSNPEPVTKDKQRVMKLTEHNFQ